MNMQFIVNQKGVKTSVIIPFEEWERLNVERQKMKKKLEILEGIADGLKEIRDNKKKIKCKTLDEFLNESSNKNYKKF